MSGTHPATGACAHRRRTKGLTLVEVLFGIVLFSISISVLIGSMVFGYRVIKVNSHKIAALSVARRKIENLMNLNYNNLSTSGSTYDESGVVIDSVSGLASDLTVAVDSAGTNKKRISVTVQWNEMGKDFSVSLQSLSAKHNVT